MMLDFYYLVNLITALAVSGLGYRTVGMEPTAITTSPVARLAGDFTSSLSIQVHMNYNAASGHPNSPYGSNTMVADALAYLNPGGIGTGIGTVRDTAFYSNAIPGLDYIAGLGYRLDLYMSYDAQHSDYSAQYAALSRFVSSGFVRVIEGGLEVDGFRLVRDDTYTGLNGTRYTGWQAAVAMQMDLWSRFHSTVPVALFSLATPSNGHANSPAVAAAKKLGTSLTEIANYGNVHFYQANGDAPASPSGGQLAGVIASETGYTPGLPFMITETGFNDIHAAGYAGTPLVDAKYTMNLLLSAFMAGCALTNYYELFDENQGYSGSEDFQDHWGLFNDNGTPKQSAVALHNFLSVISDRKAASFKPGSLKYQISGLSPLNGHSLLFQKSDGSFVLALWAEANIYSNAVPRTATTQTVTVALPGIYEIDVYDPMLNAAALAGRQSFLVDATDSGHLTTTQSNTVKVSVVDHPILIRITDKTAVTPTSPPGRDHLGLTDIQK
ncbi:hypothetical protein [Rhodopila sp.]|uniref:hypothetical protein n=1 Tax=Rhodopila sp. TaxID=2480087 RepID=UPI003D11670A